MWGKGRCGRDIARGGEGRGGVDWSMGALLASRRSVMGVGWMLYGVGSFWIWIGAIGGREITGFMDV